jgi:LPS-assembly protein
MSRSGDSAERSAERTPYGVAALAAVAAVCAAPVAFAQQVAPAEQPSVLLEADQVVNDEAAGTVIAEGDVQVRYQQRTLRADELIYNLNTGAIRASGNVQVVSADGSITYANEIEADEALNVGAAHELRARLGQSGTLVARTALRRSEGESELRNIVYTSCPICQTSDRPPTWSLRARRAVQDLDNRTVSYRGAVVEVAGVPVLYLPFFAHPDPSVDRASGFLPPKIGRNDRLGTFYEQPYHWAISPSQDMTTGLRLHGNVNPLAAVEYRKRFWSGDLQLQTTFTQEQIFDSDGNRFGENRLRYSAFAQGKFEISDYWNWGFGVEHIYDDDYLRRYDLQGAAQRRGPFIGQETRLISQLYAIGQDARSYSAISFVDFQGLRDADSADLLPVILPYAETERVLDVLGGQLRVQASTAVLARDDNPATLGFEGSNARASLGATWRRDAIFGPGLVLSPFAQARGDVYQVETAGGDSETVTRGLGLAGAEVSWPFMRPGERFDLIVEPVAMAAIASENADDPRIVNEDSLAFELDDSNLFRPNGAPNYDLWEPGARLSLGVRGTARARTGENLSVLFGRRWRDEVAPGFTEINNLDGRSTDWVGAVQADFGRNFGGEARVRLDNENFEVNRIDLGVRGAVGRFHGNARYFTVDDTLSPGDPNRELTAQAGVELARGWRMQLGVTRDLDSDINLRQDIRAIYEDDCTFLEIAYTRSETQRGTIGPDEGVQIRIGLRSLGVFGGS